MPLKSYFKGHGSEVMRSMRKKYGERAEEVFYATANKQKMNPEAKKHARSSLAHKGRKA